MDQDSPTSSQDRIRCAVVGVGRMGRHHARVYAQMEGIEFVGVVDSDRARAAEVTAQFGGRPLTDIESLIDIGAQAVTVAVPTRFHRSIALPLLRRGVACLIEKPLAPNVFEAEEIAQVAAETGTLLQVGHIERYNPAVRAITAQAGLKPRFIEVHRVSPMSFRSVDVGVVFDVMIHDLDVVLMLTGEEPSQIQAVSVAVLGAQEDVCNARLEFPSGCVANVTASRLAMKTERKLRLIGEDAYVSVDYARKSGLMIRKTANEQQLADLRARLAAGEDLSGMDYTGMVNIEPLQVDDADSLQMQLHDFVCAVRAGRRPTVDVHAGFTAVRTAERIVEAANAHRDRLGVPSQI